jgi:hypothetical protein
MLLNETDIERQYEPPTGYDPEQQGEWDASLVTFGFKRRIHLDAVERDADRLAILYKLEGAGYWQLEFTPEQVTITRV